MLQKYVAKCCGPVSSELKEMLRKATVNMEKAFARHSEPKSE